MKKRTICMSMILALCLSLAPGLSIPALAADPVTYLDPLDKEHPEKVCSSYSEIEKKTKALGNGWYVVTEYVDCTSRIEVTGHANLILGASMNVEAGIHLPDSSACSLTIWVQKDRSGFLIVGDSESASEGCAGIGGNDGEDGGTLTVNGGIITAAGGKWGAGIGGGNVGKGGKITINGGSVTAQGGSEGAGIGGGDECDGGTVEINGGTVEAKGGNGTTQAIGHGDENTNTGQLSIYQYARVTAGDASPGQPAAKAQRADACRNNKWAKIERCRVHAFENGICKWCGADIAVTGSLKDETLRYSVTAPAGALVIAARYDNGQMMDVQTVTLTDSETGGAFTMKGSGTGYKLFLLDGTTHAPLCPAWSGGA